MKKSKNKLLVSSGISYLDTPVIATMRNRPIGNALFGGMAKNGIKIIVNFSRKITNLRDNNMQKANIELLYLLLNEFLWESNQKPADMNEYSEIVYLMEVLKKEKE